MKKFHNKSFTGLCLIAGLAITLYGCEKEKTSSENPPDESLAATKIVTTVGDPVKLCDAKAQSFVCKDEQGNPVSIGFVFSEDALNNLPDEMATVLIPVPKNHGTLVDHISVDYQPIGHEPPGIYDKPHFDIHFYMIPESEQMMIDNGPEMEILPAAEFIPPNYQATPGGVPMMGKHFSDVTSKEFNGQPFDRTFVYGSYNGKFIFHEPMITVAYFKSKQSFNDDVKQQPKVQREGYYPKNYSVTYDATNKVYTVMLSNLVLRKP
jgi:hypothetical protein